MSQEISGRSSNMSVVDGPATRVPGTQQPGGGPRRSSLFDRAILGRAAIDSVRKLDPRVQVKNPVMFVVLIGTIVTLVESAAHSSVFAWSVTEFEFLAYLARNVGKVCTRQMILESVWGPQYAGETHYLKVYAYRIRRKLRDEGGDFLQSDPSVGYRLVPPAGSVAG